MVNLSHTLALLSALCFSSTVAVDDVSATVQPPKFRPNVTARVTFTCAFAKGANSGFKTVSELRLVDAKQNGVITKINVLDNNANTFLAPAAHVSATGNINGNVGGKLTTYWDKPDLNHPLDFKCVALGVGMSGSVIRAEKNISVGVETQPLTSPTSPPGPGGATQTIDDLKAIIHSQSQTIAKLTDLCSSTGYVTKPPGSVVTQPQGPGVTKPPGPVVTQPGAPLPAQNVHYPLSSAFQGHTYHLTELTPSDRVREQVLCKNMGGRLAELTTQAEYLHVTAFLKAKNIGDQVYIGVSYDDFRKRFYYFSNTNQAITYSDWDSASHQPHPEGDRNCVVIMPNGHMSSTVCSGAFKRRYLCEK